MIVLVLKKENGKWEEEEENEQEIGECKSHKLWQKRVSINGRAVSRVQIRLILNCHSSASQVAVILN